MYLSLKGDIERQYYSFSPVNNLPQIPYEVWDLLLIAITVPTVEAIVGGQVLVSFQVIHSQSSKRVLRTSWVNQLLPVGLNTKEFFK